MGFYSAGGEADTLLNRGQIEVADGAALINRRSSTITNDASGHISSTGTGQVASGSELDTTFNEAGTTLGPAPVRIYGGTLNYTGDGGSHIEAEGQFNLTGTLHAGQSLTITDAQANAFSGFTNAAGGDLRIHSRGFTSSLNTGDAPLLNRGTITLTGAGTPGTDTALFGPVTNAPGALVRAEYNLGLYTGGAVADTFLNQGRLEAADGVTVIVRRSATFTNAAGGHIEGEGTGHVLSGAELDNTFNEAGTTDGPRPVVVGGRDAQLHRRRHERHRGDRPVQPRRDPAGRPGPDDRRRARERVRLGLRQRRRPDADRGVRRSAPASTWAPTAVPERRHGSGPSVAPASRCSCSATSTTPGTIDLQPEHRLLHPVRALATLDNGDQLTIADGKTLDLKRSSVFEQSAGRTTLDGARRPGSRCSTPPA